MSRRRVTSVALGRRGQRYPRRRRARDAPACPLAQRADRREEERDEKHAYRCGEEHPEEHPGADRVAALRTGWAQSWRMMLSSGRVPAV